MKDGLLRVYCASPEITLGDSEANARECARIAKSASELCGGVILFPALTLTGATLGDLYLQSVVTDGALRSLGEYMSATAELELVSVIGLPIRRAGELYSCMAVVYRGKPLAIIPKKLAGGVFASGEGVCDSISVLGHEVPFCCDLIMDFAYPRSSSLAVAFADELLSCASTLGERVRAGAGLVLCPDSLPITCEGDAPTVDLILSESKRCGCAIAYANASFGESGTDALFGGGMLVCECGERLSESAELSGESLVFSEVDFGIIYAKKEERCVGVRSSDLPRVRIENRPVATALSRKYPRLPYIKAEDSEAPLRIVKIQARALAERVKRSHSRTMVLGVSGGLDSTLALIAAVEACEVLGVTRDSVVALTMPCFGTSRKTRGNAELLCEALGVTLRTVDIKAAVSGHLADIGHDGKTPDAAFENAQARERTQILMDTANACGGIVVGTGDLSELALGFCTYGGDHMSMYSINTSLPKTLMQMIVKEYARSRRESHPEVYRVLCDILGTPISPELLPPDSTGDIAQCTEEIVGPYALHDFFIYYFVGYGFSPKKLLRLSLRAFDGAYTEGEIKNALVTFIRRFFSSQFKRSCSPDGPRLTAISFSPRAGAGLSMPSDAVCREWLRDIDGE